MNATTTRTASAAAAIGATSIPLTQVQLRLQLFTGLEPRPERLLPIVNYLVAKPCGGLWTSTWRGPRRGSAWVTFCRGYRWDARVRQPWWLLAPHPSARLAIVDALADYYALCARYPREDLALSDFGPVIDFVRMACDYDGLRLTAREATRMLQGLAWPGLLGWDCESTLWFRWVFDGPARQVPQSSERQKVGGARYASAKVE